MIVRDMEKSDIPQLARLYNQFWDGDTSQVETMYSKFEKLQGNGTHILLSAVEGHRLVGTVMGVICEELYGKCKAFLVLENLIINPVEGQPPTVDSHLLRYLYHKGLRANIVGILCYKNLI